MIPIQVIDDIFLLPRLCFIFIIRDFPGDKFLKQILWRKGLNIRTLVYFLYKVVDLDNKSGVGDDVIGRSLRTKHIMAVVECEDANENTPLSEAASKCNF